MKCKIKPAKPSISEEILTHLPDDYVWKVLGWLTDDLDEFISIEFKNELRLIIRKRCVLSLLEFADAWALQSRITTGGLSSVEYAAEYQLVSLLKKYQFKGDQNTRKLKALEKFTEAEKFCAAYNLEDWKRLVFSKNQHVINILSYAKGFLRRLLGDRLPSGQIMTEWSRHGPGANLDTLKGRTSLYDKYANWPYSCTVDALRYARYAIATDQRWIGALMSDYRERLGIPQHFPIDMETFWSNVLKVVDGNRITFVPKNAKVERSIAIEPSMNLYLQLGVDGFIRKRLKRYGVDLDDQTKNQELARLGSLKSYGYDSFVTIDLAGASDSVSLKICELMLPPEWYRYLIDLRSPVGDCKGIFFEYEKISSMGNGYTFALESSIFTAIIYGVLMEFEGKFDPEECAIYGDDLIVRRKHSTWLIYILALSGFRVNLEKTFINGPFRESCGCDWVHGAPVRPVFFDHAHTNVMGLFTDVNRLKRVLSLRFGLEEANSTMMMIRWIPAKCEKFKGPYSDEEFDSYLHVPLPIIRQKRNSCIWKYCRLNITPVEHIGPNFLFRKLMANLRPVQPKNIWDKHSKAEGVFTVTYRDALHVGKTYSVSSDWRYLYNEYLPPSRS